MKKILLVVIAVMVLLSGCNEANQTQNTNEVKNVSSIHKAYVMCGKITSNETVDVSSSLSSKITKLDVNLGSKVNAGDTIASLDTSVLGSQLKGAEAGVAASRAKLNQLLTPK